MSKSQTTKTLAKIVEVLRALDKQAVAFDAGSIHEHVTGGATPNAHDSTSIVKIVAEKAHDWDSMESEIAESIHALIRRIHADTGAALAAKGVVVSIGGDDPKNPVPRSVRDLADADKDFLLDQLLRETNKATHDPKKAEDERPEFDPVAWARQQNGSDNCLFDFAEGN